jgi:hypothetical protein
MVAGQIPIAASPTSVASSIAAGQLPATTTNDNAAAGRVGEYVESNIPIASGLTATSGAILNVTSISLTAGDWDVWGVVAANGSGAILVDFRGGVGTVSGGLPDQSRYAAWQGSWTTPTISLVAPQQRLSLASPTTIYLTSFQFFSTAALTVGGTLSARRAR